MSVKLTNLNPQWIDHDSRHGLGVSFDCMVGKHGERVCKVRNWILFANPLDGGQPWPGESRSLILAAVPKEEDRWSIAGCGTCRWQRTGDTFESLSMSPSVNAGACGHMILTDGEFR